MTGPRNAQRERPPAIVRRVEAPDRARQERRRARLAALGAPVTPDGVVSSPRATALYLSTQAPEVRRVLTVGA